MLTRKKSAEDVRPWASIMAMELLVLGCLRLKILMMTRAMCATEE